MKYLLAEMTSEEVKDKASAGALVIIPTGATEQHGRHLPLDFDYFTVNSVAVKAAEEMVSATPIIVTPGIAFGCSQHHMAYAGTLSLNFYTYIDMVFQVALSLVRHGFKKFLFLNGHGGNKAALNIVVNRLDLETDVAVAVTANYWDLCIDTIERIRDTGTGGMGHGGEFETSLGLYLRASLVYKNKMQKNCISPRLELETLDLIRPSKVVLPWRADTVRGHGIIGDPLKASADKGDIFFKAAVKGVIDLTNDINKLADSLSTEENK